MINKYAVLLLSSLVVALPAFAGQHVAVHPRTSHRLRRPVDDPRDRGDGTASPRSQPPPRSDFSQRTLAEDYVAITPLGQVTTKQDTVSARKSGQLRYDTIDVSDMVVRVYGDTAVVTARADVKGHQLGEDFSGPYRYTRVWVRRTGHWQAVSYQATVTQ